MNNLNDLCRYLELAAHTAVLQEVRDLMAFRELHQPESLDQLYKEFWEIGGAWTKGNAP